MIAADISTEALVGLLAVAGGISVGGMAAAGKLFSRLRAGRNGASADSRITALFRVTTEQGKQIGSLAGDVKALLAVQTRSDERANRLETKVDSILLATGARRPGK